MKLERYKDKKETRKKVVLISLTVVTLVSVTLMLYKTFAKFTATTSFSIMSGKVKYKPKGKDLNDVVIPTTSGDGLYSVNHSGASGEWATAELRYAGKNPQNYIYFNCSDVKNQSASTCEKWRIIGKVNVKTNTGAVEQRLKIIRNESIGGYSWVKLSTSHNSNDWTQASLMGLLNDTYYNSLNENKYCYQSGETPTSSCNFSAGQTAKGLTSLARDMIDNQVIWNLGGWKTAAITADKMYKYERGTTVYDERPTEWTVGNTKEPSTGSLNANLFRGVGLMYPSDYGYAVGGDVRAECLTTTLYDYNELNCYSDNWLFISNNKEWLLTPESTRWNSCFYVNLPGSVDIQPCATTFNVRPVVFLNSNVKIGEGEGNEASPYTLVS